MAEPRRLALLRRLGRFNDRAAAAALWVATVCIVLLVALNAGVVAVRYGYGVYAAWIFEISRTLMITIVFLGAVHLHRTRRHIAMSFVVDRIRNGSRLKRLLEVVCELAVVVFATVVLWQAMVYQPILFRRLTPALRYPENLTSIAVPVAYLLILLTSLEALLSPRGARR